MFKILCQKLNTLKKAYYGILQGVAWGTFVFLLLIMPSRYSCSTLIEDMGLQNVKFWVWLILTPLVTIYYIICFYNPDDDNCNMDENK